MTKIRLFSRFLMMLLTILLMVACGDRQETNVTTTKADSVMNAAYQSHSYDELLSQANQLESAGSLSEIKACYWRGYAYSRQRKMRLATNWWKKAIEIKDFSEDDRPYFYKSANRLAGVLLLRGEYEATMKVAMPVMEMMRRSGDAVSSDYAFLLVSVGCCQLMLGSQQEASESFAEAYNKFQQVLKFDNSIGNYNAALVGIINITDNYLQHKLYDEARIWMGYFEELLSQYEQLPDANPAVTDRHQARLCYYLACAFEGMGKHTEAAEAYDKALLTNYGKTDDGRMEALTYLMSAKRWKEAAKNYELLDAQLSKYGFSMSIENIQRYLLPKFRANLGASNNDSALAVGMRICNSLDSAIVMMQKDDAAELAIIYQTQQKEAELTQQKADLSRQRFIVTVVVMILIIVFFVITIYIRHQSSLRLEHAYYKLEVANARAEESSRMKTAFIQQISHEIRTPLNILSGFTQIITNPDMQLDNETKNDINQKILENTNRITGLVNKMLELSDVNSKTVIERNDHVLALQIAAQAVEQCAASGSKIPVDLKLEEGAEEAMLHTNEESATRILVVLLDNAQKFTKEGYVRLIVSPQPSELRFIVEDTGIGVPKEEANHIFEEFVQLDNFNEGTGIGLTVARSLCQRLGGSVRLDTNYTDGARFIVTLPL